MYADRQAKFDTLKKNIHNYGSLAVAMSGGTDSSFLARVAHDVLGDQMIAVIAESALMPIREQCEAEVFCEREKIRYVVVKPDILSSPEFLSNPVNRCYLCKKTIMRQVLSAAKKNGMAFTAEGTNADDDNDYRPGMKAVKELGLLSPLKDAGLTKADIRAISKELGLPTWNKPSSACLASRIPYGDVITGKKLKMVEQAEQLLKDHGFGQLRVRMVGETGARIEILPEDFSMIIEPEMRKLVVGRLKKLGFIYISLDLEGFRQGSLNEVLTKDRKKEQSSAPETAVQED